MYMIQIFTSSYIQIGTGFKDEDLANHTTFFKEHVIEKARPYYSCDSSLQPDHWFDAVQVWEVKAADLSISPVHRAAAGLVSQQYFLIIVYQNLHRFSVVIQCKLFIHRHHISKNICKLNVRSLKYSLFKQGF